MTTRQKQWQLYYLGYYGGKIDGLWGSKSRAATKAFQADNGLSRDGIFGAKTDAKSREVIAAIQTVVGAEADGLAGPKTVEATKAYQKAAGIAATGIAEAVTRAKIQENETDFWDGIKYFGRGEFACKCGGKYCNGFPAEPKKALVIVADRVREHFGKPMVVTSGVRCASHNKNEGGAGTSLHMSGRAVDFYIRGVSAKDILAFVKQQPEIRYTYAIDAGAVHMDIG